MQEISAVTVNRFLSRLPRMDDQAMECGRLIKAARKKKKWSQTKLAVAISKVEGRKKNLTYQTVQIWEHGKAMPSRKRAGHVARVLEEPKIMNVISGQPTTYDAKYAELGRYWEHLPEDVKDLILRNAREGADKQKSILKNKLRQLEEV
jgi:transcriptional regulator with XRE-family HTH domain